MATLRAFVKRGHRLVGGADLQLLIVGPPIGALWAVCIALVGILPCLRPAEHLVDRLVLERNVNAHHRLEVVHVRARLAVEAQPAARRSLEHQHVATYEAEMHCERAFRRCDGEWAAAQPRGPTRAKAALFT